MSRDGWRDIAAVLSRQLSTPLNVVLDMTLGEAVEWYESVRRINAPPPDTAH